MPILHHERRAGWMGPCSNVFPTRTLQDLLAHLNGPLPALKRRCGLGEDDPFGVGLWIPAVAAGELVDSPAAMLNLKETLARNGLYPFTLNGFPYGDFHAERVREAVFAPSWAEPRRLEYTLQLIHLLAQLLPVGGNACISTVPLGFASLNQGMEFEAACAENLKQVATACRNLFERSGIRIRLALEPEPRGTVETMADLASFAERHLDDASRRWVVACWDLCHQAVVGESVEDGLSALQKIGMDIGKIQLSAALVAGPGDDAALLDFTEERYLHQVGCELSDGNGQIELHEDLGDLLRRGRRPREGEIWRVHFHVPLHRPEVSGLKTTQFRLKTELSRLLAAGVDPIIELETYSWGVLPGEAPADDEALVEGLAREMAWARDTLQELGSSGPGPGQPGTISRFRSR